MPLLSKIKTKKWFEMFQKLSHLSYSFWWNSGKFTGSELGAWWRYWNTLQIFLYRSLYTGGLYSGWEFRGYIPSFTVLLVMTGGVIFFWVIVAGELLIWEVNIYHYIRIGFRIVKHDWNELKLQKKKKKNAALPKTCSSRVGMFRSSDEQLFLKYLCLIFTMDVGNSRLLIQTYPYPFGRH